LILALVRDAEVPSFYSDIQRYWTSLDDVTGKHALFAVAAANAAGAFKTASVLKRRRRFSGDISVVEKSSNRHTWDVPMDHVRQQWQLSTVAAAKCPSENILNPLNRL